MAVIELPKPATRGRGRAHRVFHPLAGADLATLARVLGTGGRIPPSRFHVPVIAVACALLRAPFTGAEALARRVMLKGHRLPPPIFVVGYWRSGTTHLSNVLSRWPGLGILPPISVGLPHEALGLARLIAPFIEQFYPKTRLIDAVPLGPELPQEDELAIANMSPISFYHGIYFPGRLDTWLDRGLFFDGVSPDELDRWKAALHGYVAAMTLQQGRRPVLIRNPAHCAKIAVLRSMWPDAKFIHVHRDPYIVHASATRLFDTLLKELATQHRAVDPDPIVMRTYPRMLTALLDEAERLPPGCFTELRFEAFERDPLRELQRMFDELGLDGFAAARPAFADYLDGVRSYRKSEHRIDPRTIGRVRERWQPVLQRLGRDVPDRALAC